MKQRKIYALLLALNLVACDLALLDENPDSAAEGPLPEGKPGQACDAAGKCPEGYLCIEKSGYPNGKCAAICQTDDDCADDCLICSERQVCEGVSKGVKRGNCNGEFQECNGNGSCTCSGHRGGENCSECAIGFSGENCQECAPNFTGNECAECKPGYYGQTCQKCACGDKEYCQEGRSGNGECFSCPEFYAGLKCNIKIKCRHGILNPLTGNCHENSCAAEYTGLNCDECKNPHKTGSLCNSCREGYLGDDCEIEILCKNGKVDSTTGHCQNGSCKTGWEGEDCDECAAEYTGINCDECKNPHKTGSLCDSCREGYLGDDCEIEILCKNGEVDSTTGHCQNGSCQTGWTGEDCDECANNLTGRECDKKILCENGTLDKETGHCQSGSCKTGWDGEDCQKCAAAFTGANCAQCKDKNRFGEKCDQCTLGADGTAGTLKDNLDNNKEYKTVVINCQEWMAENYKRQTDSSTYPGGDSNNMATYGLLYDWATASASGFCPSGWHLPSKEEFEALLDYVGEDGATRGKNLRAGSWVDDEYGPGKDKYGFAALPAGGEASHDYYNFGSKAYFWSSSKRSLYDSYMLEVNNNYAKIEDFGNTSMSFGHSVRCLKD